MNKYLIIGGNVISKRDGQEHYVPSTQLLLLYKVPLGADYILVDSWTENRLRGLNKEDFIILRPRSDGNYDLHEEQELFNTPKTPKE